MGVENNDSCSQRDSAERKGYVRAHRSFNRIWKERDSAEPDILGKILDRDNINRAYKRVKANKGAPGVDGMTIEEAKEWLKENHRDLTERIRRGKYTPSPVKGVEIPKPDGGVRKLGIPIVVDRIIQQAMAQQLMPLYESKEKLRRLTSRSRCGSIVRTMERIKVYMRGWLNYYGIADMKKNIEELNSWLYRRKRMCIWKQWKLPRSRMRKRIGLGVDSHYAVTIAYDRKGYWFNAGNKAVNWARNKERLIHWGFYDLAEAYQSVHVNC